MTPVVFDNETLTGRATDAIRVTLARHRISGRELARRLDVSPNWVSLRLTGAQNISLEDVERIADALGIEAGQLVGGGEPARPKQRRATTLPPAVLRKIQSALDDPDISAIHKQQLVATTQQVVDRLTNQYERALVENIDDLLAMWNEMRQVPIYREPQMRRKG